MTLLDRVFFLFFLMTDLYFLIPAVIAQTFKPIAELATPTEIPANKQMQKSKHNH